MKILFIFLALAIPVLFRSVVPGKAGTGQDDLQKSVERGKEVYSLNCVSCHQAAGEGISGVYPPLAKNDRLSKDQTNSIPVILNGQNEEITVNGVKYAVPMAPFNQLSDEQIADVLNYIGNNWGNRFNTVMPSQVKSMR